MRGVLLCRITFALSLDVFFFFSLFPPSFLDLEEGNKIGIANTRMNFVSFCCKKRNWKWHLGLTRGWFEGSGDIMREIPTDASKIRREEGRNLFLFERSGYLGN